MSLTALETTNEENETTRASDSAVSETNASSLFTYQTGQVLITLGTLFKHVPPFNESIDRHTGDMLISLGKKLKGKN